MNYITALAESDMSSVLGNGLSLAEKAFTSGRMALMGLGTVFAVLFIIWFMLTIFRVVLGAFTTKKEPNKPIEVGMTEETSKKVPSQKKTENPASKTPVVEEKLDSGDAALVAVITAAISSYIENETGGGANLPFKVVSFKRKDSAKPWNGRYGK